MQTFIELNWHSQEERESLVNEKIRSWRWPIAAGYRGGRSRSAKSHYKTCEKPQYTI
jgi:hypothetical protein